MPKLIDLTGRIFGRLTVLSRADDYILPNGKPRVQYLCQCFCGKKVVVSSQNLRQGTAHSCGCLRAENFKKPVRNMRGKRFGKLTVVSQERTKITPSGQHKIMWRCLCDCGSYVVVEGSALRSGKTQSCGCVKSRLEEKISSILNGLSLSFRKQVSFDDLRTFKGGRTYFDFGIYINHYLFCLVEAQGIQHYREDSYAPWFGSYERDVTDLLKRDYCKQNKIPLVEISYLDNPEYEILSMLIDLQGNTVPSVLLDEGVTTISQESRLQVKFLGSKCHASDISDEDIV